MDATYAKVKTGIPGLDSIMAGGLKQGRSTVVSGPPGSGKTTLGLQFLQGGAKDFDEPGIYISLAQNINEIKKDCTSFGWDFDNLIEKDRILMIDARPFKVSDDSIGKDDSLYRGEQMPFEHLTKLILSSIKRIEAKRLVIDSITILIMQYSNEFYIRQGLQGLIQAIENYGVTSILLSEITSENQIPPEWFVSSGVIQLRHTRNQDNMERSIQITKLRGISHNEQIHPLEIGDNGLRVLHPRIHPI
ncbi:MAG: recombinase RecA [Nitrosopumilaceae archaeon]|nr:recombinase RecA [Nitrosopumilaceae archaeon]NIU01996.1 recombinase RecA [Nitrosopumilaceae archaeon]NIU87147.1 recombinase RecA [Nitrosopumilaceae archaeon]NIV64637.1 recombinase RecA [Nitrosopumilaceae archaeon]NIX62597.1 recombinase RecA [Nitrosopumilaceae archaeon]